MNVNTYDIPQLKKDPRDEFEKIEQPSKIDPKELEKNFVKLNTSSKHDESENPPCYLPQPDDDKLATDHLKPMGPIGPWATGKVDWSPLAGYTGLRPVVDRYSITRFSPSEWRAKNEKVLQTNKDVLDKALKNQYSSKTALVHRNALNEKTQIETTESLTTRAQLIFKWKNIIEMAIKSLAAEISTLEEERLRLKKSLVILGKPELIAKECLMHRNCRPETELVRDLAEEELVNEVSLIAEIRQLLKKTLKDFEQQQVDNRTARQRLEYDWSDKEEAYGMEVVNVGLNSRSKTVMFHPGAVRQPVEQSSEQYWEHFSKATLEDTEKCRQRSVALRQTLDSILLNASRDVRTQADVVEKALVSKINCTQESLKRFENELRECLQKLADIENHIVKLNCAISSFDPGLKVAQTRIDNRSYRPNVENCGDRPQKDLIDEVVTIHNGVTTMKAELDAAENIKLELMNSRSALEKEIMLKRRTLWIDRDICMALRSHYPSVNALTGYVAI